MVGEWGSSLRSILGLSSCSPLPGRRTRVVVEVRSPQSLGTQPMMHCLSPPSRCGCAKSWVASQIYLLFPCCLCCPCCFLLHCCYPSSLCCCRAHCEGPREAGVLDWILCFVASRSDCPRHEVLGSAETLSTGDRSKLLIAQYYLASLWGIDISYQVWDNEPLLNFLPISKTFPPLLVSKPRGALQVGQYCDSNSLIYS